jgi:hypothetical protein
MKYHLSTIELLESRQIQRYGELRGYAGTTPTHRHH